MAAKDNDPPAVRLVAAAEHFDKLAATMRNIAEQVRSGAELHALRDANEKLRMEVVDAELERNEARDRVALLEECIEDLRLGIRDSEEVIEACRPIPTS